MRPSSSSPQWLFGDMPTMDAHTETVYTFCIQKFYKMYTTDVYKMYAKFKQNVYHISRKFCIHFVFKIKRTMPAKFYIQNVYKNWLKFGIHFVYPHFVYILYTKVCRNVGYILYTNILYTFSIATFCIPNAYKSLPKVGIHFVYKRFVYILYISILIYKKRTSWTLCIQFVYKIHTKCINKYWYGSGHASSK